MTGNVTCIAAFGKLVCGSVAVEPYTREAVLLGTCSLEPDCGQSSFCRGSSSPPPLPPPPSPPASLGPAAPPPLGPGCSPDAFTWACQFANCTEYVAPAVYDALASGNITCRAAGNKLLCGDVAVAPIVREAILLGSCGLEPDCGKTSTCQGSEPSPPSPPPSARLPVPAAPPPPGSACVPDAYLWACPLTGCTQYVLPAVYDALLSGNVTCRVQGSQLNCGGYVIDPAVRSAVVLGSCTYTSDCGQVSTCGSHASPPAPGPILSVRLGQAGVHGLASCASRSTLGCCLPALGPGGSAVLLVGAMACRNNWKCFVAGAQLVNCSAALSGGLLCKQPMFPAVPVGGVRHPPPGTGSCDVKAYYCGPHKASPSPHAPHIVILCRLLVCVCISHLSFYYTPTPLSVLRQLDCLPA
jgi:hypothetical protein